MPRLTRRSPESTLLPMESAIRLATVALLLGVFLSSGAAAEESAGEVTAVSAVPAEPQTPGPALAIPDAEEVPDAEKAGRSREHLERMREILTKVLKHLEDAREERDVIKLNCVNEKLTAVKGLLKISEQADVAMQEALARRNPEVAQHEYEKIAIASSKCEQLFAESEACVGELAVYAGDTQVEVEIEGEPPVDISEEMPFGELITRPPAASPYQ